ncbi:MAG: 50S ribosomal protein L9 [Patescibacteria group bacterium]|jgi:large subunit ribosomal protein L9
MLVTLLENVASLGAEGQSVEVPEGYATHFLFPQHLAVEGGEKTLKEIKSQEPTKAELAEEKLAAEIDGLEVVIPVKSVKGKPKSAVTATEIRKGLKELGYTVPKDAIKTLQLNNFTTSDVPVEFSSGFEAQIKVTLEPA